MKKFNLKKNLIFGVIMLFTTTLFSTQSYSACSGDYWVCASWWDDVASDIDNNCDGEFHGVIHTILDC